MNELIKIVLSGSIYIKIVPERSILHRLQLCHTLLIFNITKVLQPESICLWTMDSQIEQYKNVYLLLCQNFTHLPLTSTIPPPLKKFYPPFSSPTSL